MMSRGNICKLESSKMSKMNKRSRGNMIRRMIKMRNISLR